MYNVSVAIGFYYYGSKAKAFVLAVLCRVEGGGRKSANSSNVFYHFGSQWCKFWWYFCWVSSSLALGVTNTWYSSCVFDSKN